MVIPNNVRTSGAYVLYNGLFIFQVGPTKKGDRLGVVRLGGHRENNETAWETAKREVFEEAQINIHLIDSTVTFYLAEWGEEPEKVIGDEAVSPILIKGNEESSYTVMYLATTESLPTPSGESKGLVMLSPAEVQLICSKKLSLYDYQKSGGTYILKSEFDMTLLLQPFPQLQFLSRLLNEEAALMQRFIDRSLIK
ncbi:NUDIX domain-containing protein [Jeotgalibacillus sp. ET6]|uniref:NUDIX domain-containing protein n=1 Tax=Jeotgalibacillus sp. ET6 TaxID=3037260 RepID=UPI0024189636|nr:NUDIX domain-containing protein [Jeotgalibacillus sp. ET6]MDG5471268.1 NUDIX domain-containing protein [Jeotgalibacillus sp. ET6]